MWRVGSFTGGSPETLSGLRETSAMSTVTNLARGVLRDDGGMLGATCGEGGAILLSQDGGGHLRWNYYFGGGP